MFTIEKNGTGVVFTTLHSYGIGPLRLSVMIIKIVWKD
jgi:hypothetical protein